MKKIFKVFSIIFVILILLAILLILLSSGDYHVPKTVSENPELPVIELNSYKFHGETFGNSTNPPVIILHGGPGADYRYLYALKPLAGKFFLVYYDQRGTGLSPRVSSDQLTLKQYIADVDSFVNFFGKGKPVYIIGHSWGAMLASLYAGKYPRKVKCLVLAEPGFLKPDSQDNKMQGPSLSLLIKAGWSFLQSIHIPEKNDPYARKDYVYTTIIAEMSSDLYNVQHPLKQWRGGYAVFENMALKIFKDPQLYKNLNFAEGVENFKNNVLFLCGENSSLSGSALQRKHIKFFPRAQLVIIKNAGHYMFNDAPEECINVIEDYFNRQ